MTTKNPAAVALGKLGGRSTSAAKSAAAAANGRKGGRPVEIIYSAVSSLFRDQHAPKEYRRLYSAYCKHYGYKARVEGGWKFFETVTDYDIWRNQR